MSRTLRGEKPFGFEYWGRRGYPAVRMADPGRYAKVRTHRVERRQRRIEVRTAVDEMIADYRDDAEEMRRYFEDDYNYDHHDPFGFEADSIAYDIENESLGAWGQEWDDPYNERLPHWADPL